MPKNLNNAFYINKLHLININLLLNQPVDNMQSPPIQKNRKKGFIIKNIIIEVKNKKKKDEENSIK